MIAANLKHDEKKLQVDAVNSNHHRSIKKYLEISDHVSKRAIAAICPRLVCKSHVCTVKCKQSFDMSWEMYQIQTGTSNRNCESFC